MFCNFWWFPKRLNKSFKIIAWNRRFVKLEVLASVFGSIGIAAKKCFKMEFLQGILWSVSEPLRPVSIKLVLKWVKIYIC